MKKDIHTSTDEEIAHLKGFADAFIDPSFSDRWLHVLLEQPSKAASQLKKFERHLNLKHCVLVENVEQLKRLFPELYSGVSGLYFDGVGPARTLTIEKAIEQSTDDVCDAIYSIRPCCLALFFFHEGWLWVCKRG